MTSSWGGESQFLAKTRSGLSLCVFTRSRYVSKVDHERSTILVMLRCSAESSSQVVYLGSSFRLKLVNLQKKR